MTKDFEFENQARSGSTRLSVNLCKSRTSLFDKTKLFYKKYEKYVLISARDRRKQYNFM